MKTFDRFAVLAAIAIFGSLLLAPASAAQGPTPVTPVYNIDEPGRIPYQATVQALGLMKQDVVVTFDAIPQGHVFAENLPPANCDQQVNCVFLGFKDLPFKEGNNQNYHNDWDYNDFEVMVYGVSINGSQSVVTPEPSSMMLLAGVPFAFVIRKLRNLI